MRAGGTGSMMPSVNRTDSPPPPSCTRHGRKFIAGLPMKPATKRVRGIVVQFLRRADLLDHAVVHHHHAVGQGHRLDLVVRHVNDGGL